jgi:hypothetical protein
MKLTFKLYYVQLDQGDGSASTLTFGTRKDAEDEIARQEGEDGYSISVAPSTKRIVVDTASKTLTVDGIKIKAE